jgi:hypothetical protein
MGNMASDFQAQEELSWEPLSWYIENQYEDFFQDTLLK